MTRQPPRKAPTPTPTPQGADVRLHRGSKRAKGQGPRAGYDDKRYHDASRRLRVLAPAICAWCRMPIDLQLKSPHPLSWTADHIIPRSQLHPLDERHWHISNLTPMHRRCNSSRGDRPMADRPPLTTSIEW